MKERGEYGRFFPWSMAYSGYNASLAALHYPDETRASVEACGGRWEEPPKSGVPGVAGSDMPDHIEEVGEEWIGKVIACSATGKPFNIV